MAIVGKFLDEYIIQIGLQPDTVQYSTGYLYRNGVSMKIVSDCLIELTLNEVVYNVRCPLHNRSFSTPGTRENPVIIKPLGALTGA